MNQELDKIVEKAEGKYNRMLDLSLRVTDDYISSRRLDVEQLRNLIVQISVVSFAAVGFSIPIIGSSSLVINYFYFILGLLLLLVSALGGLWYSAIVAENSIIESHEAYLTNKEEADVAIENQVFLMQHPDKYDEFVVKVKKFSKEIREKTEKNMGFKRDKMLYVLLTVLSLGIICIFISILPFDHSMHGFQLSKYNKFNLHKVYNHR